MSDQAATVQEPSQATAPARTTTSAAASPQTAVVLAPGGLPAIECHLGAWLALHEAGIRPTQICGCSAGAVAGAIWAAGRLDAQGAINVVTGLRTEDLVVKRTAWKARLGWLEHIANPAPITELLGELLPEDFEHLRTPLVVSTMQMLPVQIPRWWRRGPYLREAVQASAAIAGVWPYVQVDEGLCSDGTTADAIIQPDVMSGRVIVLNIARSRSFHDRDRNVISRMIWNLESVMEKEAREARLQWARCLQRNLLWIDLDISGQSCLKFSDGHRLISAAYDTVRQALANPDPIPF